MAKLIQAVSTYGPRVEVSRTLQTREIAEYMSARTSLNRGEIEGVLREFHEALIFFAKQGMSVKLEGLGIFTPSINLEGTLDVGFRLDTGVDGALNVPGAFMGNITNRENIGKTSTELKEKWNAEHPNDLIP
jgi:hypothetical protein